MAEFRMRVDGVVRNIEIAEAAGLPYEAFLHRRRLRELLASDAARRARDGSFAEEIALASADLAEG